MTNRLHLPWLAALVRTASILVLAFVASFASTAMGDLVLNPGSGIDIEISSDFQNPPIEHAIPMRVKITNRSPADGTWRFYFNSNSYGSRGFQSTVDLTVEAGQTRIFSVVVPVEEKENHWMNLLVRAEGPGVREGQVYLSHSAPGGGSASTHFIAMSTSLAVRSLEPLRQELDKKKWLLRATQFNAGTLPEQWRGFAGARWVAMSDQEWATLTPGTRNAIRQWVGTGGRLILASTDPTTVSWSGFGAPSGSGPFPYGFGDVRALPWNKREIATEVMIPLLTESSMEGGMAEAGPEWDLLKKWGDIHLNKGMILVIVIGLAVIVGPFNLFLLAPAGRRYRLFFTTPLLSLGGTALLFVCILFSDGTGGQGTRVTILHLLPGAHEAAVLQDQVSRTGLLFSRAFALDQETGIDAVRIDTYSLNRRNHAKSYAYHGGTYSGDWFQSRSVEVHRLTSVRSTRAALTVVGYDPSGAPQVVSSFSSPLTNLIMKDAAGRWWKGDLLRTGERVTLVMASQKDCRALWHKAKEGVHELSDRMMEKAWHQYGRPGAPACFHAALTEPDREAIGTLASIRWESRAIVLGLAETAAGLPEGGAR